MSTGHQSVDCRHSDTVTPSRRSKRSKPAITLNVTALLNRIDEFMSSSFFPGKLTRIDYGSESEDEATEERLLYAILGFSSLLTAASLEKIPPACQNNSSHDRIADSSSTDPLSFSSAWTTNR